MAARTVEREVKFDVGPEFALPDLNGVVDDARQTELPRAELAATYFDTPDRRLLARGITLRHRRDRTDPTDQSQWTLKLPARLGGLALERTELTWPGELSTVPDEARRLLRAIVRHAELEAIAELVTSRRRLEIEAPGGQRLAEIDDDTVAVVDAPEPRGTFREIEVELEAEDAGCSNRSSNGWPRPALGRARPHRRSLVRSASARAHGRGRKSERVRETYRSPS